MSRCEHCGGDQITTDGCIVCGAPICCRHCCEVNSLRMEIANLKLAFAYQRNIAEELEGLCGEARSWIEIVGMYQYIGSERMCVECRRDPGKGHESDCDTIKLVDALRTALEKVKGVGE